MGLVNPILLTNMSANLDGGSYAFAGEFTNAYVTIGGSGATLGMTLFIAFFAKSEQLKILGKAALGPALFNINEPIIFGMPVVYNPILAIPFMIAPIASASIAFLAVDSGLVAKNIAQMPWPSPVGIGAFVGTAGDIKAGILAIICATVAFLIWFPFIKVYDAKLVKEEQGAA